MILFPSAMLPFLTLEAVAHGEWYTALGRVRTAVEACGWILGERAFSGVHVALQIELDPTRAAAFGRALADAGAQLDEGSLAALERVLGCTVPIPGVLALILADGDPDVRHVTPAVPG